MKGKVVAICVSDKRGTKKKNVKKGLLIKNFGLKKDAHAGNWERQISLLGIESIKKIQEQGINVKPGDFGENFTTQGIDLSKIEVGRKIKIGKNAVIEVTQIGKECHTKCNIYRETGDCIMPREGIFAKVLKGGKVEVGDLIKCE